MGVGGSASSTVASVGADVTPAGGVRSWALPRERLAAQIAPSWRWRPAGRAGGEVLGVPAGTLDDADRSSWRRRPWERT